MSSDAQSAAPTQRAFATVPPGASGGEGAVSQAVLDTVFGDLANRTNLTPETFKVTRAQAVTWPDGALGCHEPGRSYVQVLTPGYWILVEAGGKTWDYRAAASGTVKLCALPVRVPPIG